MVLLYGVEAEWHSVKGYHDDRLKSNITPLTMCHKVVYHLPGNAIYLHSDVIKAPVIPTGAFLENVLTSPIMFEE